MQYGLGIDLGTTQTAAAVRVDGRVEVVRLGGRRAEIPSLVFVKPDGGLLIGEAAERRGQSEPGRLAREFKRRFGDPVPILVGGTPFSAHALTAKLLRHVLDTVTQLQDGPPAAVTLTHPANWGPYKRELLDQAIKLADAGGVRLRTEPEAAALQHATARKIADGETVAVYDLGGGTFDVAVLRRDGDGFVLLGEPEGIEQLGGIDFDEAVFGYVLGVLGDKAEGLDPNDPEVVAALNRLRRDCVEAKESLSFDTETMIPVALPGLHTRVRLNRSELESMIGPSLADTVTATQRALRTAGITAPQLSAVLLAGGSSRIPLVAQMLSTQLQRPVIADPHPEHSIAMGAAVATAAVLGGGSPFAAAVTPLRQRGDAVRSGASPGSPATASPQRGGSSTSGGTSHSGAAAGYAGGSPGYSATASPQRGGSSVPDEASHSGAAAGYADAAPGYSATASPQRGASPAADGAAASHADVAPVSRNAGGGAARSQRGAGASDPVSGSAGSDRSPGTRSVSYLPGAASVTGATAAGATAAGATAAGATAAGATAAGATAAEITGTAQGSASSAVSDAAPAVSRGGLAQTAVGGFARTAGGVRAAPGGDVPTLENGGLAGAGGSAPTGGGFAPPTPGGPGGPPGGARGPGAPGGSGGPPGGPDLPSIGPVPHGAGTPWPPPPTPAGGKRRNVRLLVMAGAVLVALLAGGSAVALAVSNGNDDDRAQSAGVPATPSTAPSVSAAAVAAPLPTAKMLVRVDTGGDAPPERKSRVYVFTPGSDERQELAGTKVGDVLPKWSLDRSKIALTHNRSDGTNEIDVMNQDGSNRTKLIGGVSGGRVAWSKDGTKLAFVKKVNDVSQIFTIPVAGGKPTQLTKSTERKDDPAWSADGKSIIYWLERDGVKQIYELNIADPQEPGRQITGPDVGPANDPAPSPDGSQILFTRELDGNKTSDIWMVRAG
jgi:molecular chaperone DnaK